MELAELVRLPPREAAALLTDAANEDWARRFVEELDRRTRTDPVGQVGARWRLSNAEIGRMFGVSRQAVSKWALAGPPAERRAQLADLQAATELLERHVAPEHIPAVVRRGAPPLGGTSLLELAFEGRTAEVLATVKAMFELRSVQA
jgi:hypothetical protein